MPYDNGPDQHLVDLIESGRIRPCRAIDLGCGTGRNALFLAQNGFEVTGVDFATSAIAKAKLKAEAAGLKANFLVDDLTDIQNVSGTFDFLVDDRRSRCPASKFSRPVRPERVDPNSSG